MCFGTGRYQTSIQVDPYKAGPGVQTPWHVPQSSGIHYITPCLLSKQFLPYLFLVLHLACLVLLPLQKHLARYDCNKPGISDTHRLFLSSVVGDTYMHAHSLPWRLILTDIYENYLYFNINELNGRRDLPKTFSEASVGSLLSSKTLMSLTLATDHPFKRVAGCKPQPIYCHPHSLHSGWHSKPYLIKS